MAGDIVRLKGATRRRSACCVRATTRLRARSRSPSQRARRSRSGLGDVVKVYSCDDVKHGTRVQLAVVKGSSCDLNPEELLANVLTPHYMEEDDEGNPPYRPACEGDIVRVQHGAQVIEMKVMEVDSRGALSRRAGHFDRSAGGAMRPHGRGPQRRVLRGHRRCVATSGTANWDLGTRSRGRRLHSDARLPAQDAPGSSQRFANSWNCR